MTWLALAFAIQHADVEHRASLLTTWTSTGRLVDEPMLHLGVRPAAYVDGPEGGDWGVGATVQLTLDAL